MVELNDETSGSDFIETSVHAKDIYGEASKVVGNFIHGMEPETCMYANENRIIEEVRE